MTAESRSLLNSPLLTSNSSLLTSNSPSVPHSQFPILHSPFSILNSSPGFTIIEMLAAIAILTILSALLFSSLNMVTKTTSAEMGRSTIYQDARIVIDQMGRELQAAVPIVADIGGGTESNIFQASSRSISGESSIHFVAAIDNSTERNEVEVHYYYDGDNTLYKSLVFYDSGFNWDFESNFNWINTPKLPTRPIPADCKYAPILEGVKSFTFQIWTDLALPPLTSWQAKRSDIPAYVRITIEAYDPNIIRRWKSARLVGKAQANLVRSFSSLVILPSNKLNQSR